MMNVTFYDSGASGAPTPLNSTVSFSSSTQCRLFIGSDLAAHAHLPASGPLPTPTPVISITANPFGQFPCVVGATYTSQVQMCRANTQEDSKSVQGPALATLRKSHYFGMLVQNTMGMQIGTDFGSTLAKVTFTTSGGTQYQPNQLFSGVTRDVLKDGWSYDSMPTWQVTRPYPLAVCSADPMLKQQDV